jgi:hypothetical protein
MQRQTQLLRQLVLDSLYAVDASAVAEAIVMRAAARRSVMGAAFRNDIRKLPTSEPEVRSFRPSRQARSFRPATGRRPGSIVSACLRTESA